MDKVIKFLIQRKLEILAGFLIIAGYFVTRLINLDILPVFADEAIYVRWSQVMRAEPSLRFLPLSDGKTPLFMWATIPLLKFFLTNPLLAGRFLSVIAGFGTLIGIFATSRFLFGKKVALIASVFYVAVPYTFFFDRMALVDSLLNFWGIWALFLTILLAKNPRLDLAMILGGVIAAGVLTKPSGWFFLIMMPVSMILFNFKKPFGVRLAKLLGLWVIVGVIAIIGYSALRLGPNFQLIAARNRDYVFTLAEAAKHPLDPLMSHLREIWDWFGTLLTWPIFLAAIAGAAFSIWKRNKVLLFILIWAAVPLLIQAEIAKVFTARYLIFNATPLIFLSAVFTAFAFDFVAKRFSAKGGPAFGWKFSFYPLLILLLILPSIFIFNALTDPAKASLPREERSGYLEEWTAGYGIKEVAEFIKGRAKTHKIVVGTEGFFGTLPDGLQIYLEGVANVTVLGIGVPVTGPTQSLLNSLVDSEVYLVANDTRITFESSPNLDLIAKYPKPAKPDGTKESLLLFRVQGLRSGSSIKK